MLGKLDTEIRETEARIARERHMLAGSLHATGHKVRETMVAPSTLVALVGVGYILGDVMRSRRPRQSNATKKTIKSSILGLLASGAMALIKARYGSPWDLAGEVFGKMNERQRNNVARGATVQNAAAASRAAQTHAHRDTQARQYTQAPRYAQERRYASSPSA